MRNMAEYVCFVTATTAKFKTINHMLVDFRGWEYLPDTDFFYLMTSRNGYELGERCHPDEDEVASPKPGSFNSTNFDNAWAGSSVEDIEDFVRDLQRSSSKSQVTTHFFALLDDEDVRTRTVLFCSPEVDGYYGGDVDPDAVVDSDDAEAGTGDSDLPQVTDENTNEEPKDHDQDAVMMMMTTPTAARPSASTKSASPGMGPIRCFVISALPIWALKTFAMTTRATTSNGTGNAMRAFSSIERDAMMKLGS